MAIRVNNELSTIASNIQKTSTTPAKVKPLNSFLLSESEELTIKPSEVTNFIKSPNFNTVNANPFTSKNVLNSSTLNISTINDKPNKYDGRNEKTEVSSSSRASIEFSIGTAPVESNLFQSYVPQRISSIATEKNKLNTPLSRKQRKSIQDAEKIEKSISFLTPTAKSSPTLQNNDLKVFEDSSNPASHANSDDSSSNNNSPVKFNKKEEYNDFEAEIYSPPTLYGKSKTILSPALSLSKSRFLKDDALDEVFGKSNKKSDLNSLKKKNIPNIGQTNWPISSDDDD